jgi:hypothetical protein
MTSEQRRLIKMFSRLGEGDRSSLLAFAEFLVERNNRESSAVEPAPPQQPKPIARPDKESVVGAIKRLAKTYDMLDRADMLSETSSLMTAHVMHGRAAKAVIDDLEQVFSEHYRRYRQSHPV